jgi:hypothetical protein
MSSDRKSPVTRNSVTPSLVVLGVGGLFVAFGIAYQAATTGGGREPSLIDSIIGGFALALGGGAVGAAIQAVTEHRYSGDVLISIEKTIRESLGARFTSSESDLKMFKRDWHHYYLTHLNGESSWWHQEYSFGQNVAQGSITGRTNVSDADGRAHTYLTEAGVRSQRFILLETNEEGEEPAVVEVYPMPRGFQTVHAAIAFLEGWDSSNVVTKAILSEKPLTKENSKGIVRQEDWSILDKIWETQFFAHNRLTLGNTAIPIGSESSGDRQVGADR